MIAMPHHAAVQGFSVVENCLSVDGRKITEIVKDSGHTPLYVYVGNLVAARVADLRREFPPSVKIHYAMKANPHREVVNLVASLVDGIDVASGGELEIALATNIPRHEISFAGPGKRLPEIQAAVAAGIVLNVESETELARAAQCGRESNRKARVAIRVNPAFELKGSGMKMAGGPTQFGIDAERVPDVLRTMDRTNLEFEGFHIFAGSQNLRVDAICKAQSLSLELALQLASHAPKPPRFINIGGGLGIPYFPGERPIDLAAIGSHLETIVRDLNQAIPGCDLVVELGRYIVGEAGLFVSTVIDKKISRGHTYLIVDGGLHHHLSASGNFGQVIRRNYPVLIGNRIEGAGTETTVVGPLCTPLDLLADRMNLPHAEIGDLVVIFQSGAYGFSASPRGFLGHPEPAEVLIPIS
jgi:diaminopimelate decarboxylase